MRTQRHSAARHFFGVVAQLGGVDEFENSRAMVRRAFDLGITHFDLANNYGPPPGSAESNFGEILRLDLNPIAMN